MYVHSIILFVTLNGEKITKWQPILSIDNERSQNIDVTKKINYFLNTVN